MTNPAAFIRGLRHPEAYHGKHQRKGFFEGWYVKLVSVSTQERWAVIPGIFRGLDSGVGDIRDEAFVQVLNGTTGESWYHRFEVTEFRASDEKFDVWVGENHFHSGGVELKLPQLTGELRFKTELIPWPVTALAPGIMGWYAAMPFMECYHGLVSFGHELAGTLSVTGRAVSFDKGRGYIEKDWGKAFPAGYVWIHTNHFQEDSSASLVASAAIIPWLAGSSFRGFIMGLWRQGRLYQWSTPNRSREALLEIDDAEIRWRVSGSSGLLEIVADRPSGGLLHAPLRTAMVQRVDETMNGKIWIRHTDPSGTVFESTASVGCIEVFGDIERMLKI